MLGANIKSLILFTLMLSLFPFEAQALFGKAEREKRALLEYEKNTINIFEESAKSVVNVSNIKLARRGSFFDFDIMEIPAGAGSGFVWDQQGHIVTNYHVVAKGDTFLVSFHKDKKQYKAKIIGAEPKKDIAVLKLEELPKKLYPINIGNSAKLKVGQKAMAIGNPFGLDQTITAGIISALGRKIQGIGGVKIHGMIQTDSSINPGNSGGPLLDSMGNVIGMNTLIFSSSGSSAGIGFAVPINTINRIAPELIENGKISRPGLGVSLLDDSLKDHFGIKKGIVIRHVNPKSPAGRAGLIGMGRDRYGRYHLGDIITEIDGKEVNSFDDIYHALDNYKVGNRVAITYIRDGKKKKVKLKLMKL